MNEFSVGDRVRILTGGPSEHIGRVVTVGRVWEGGDVWVYFGDQDEDERVYSPHEVEKV